MRDACLLALALALVAVVGGAVGGAAASLRFPVWARAGAAGACAVAAFAAGALWPPSWRVAGGGARWEALAETPPPPAAAAAAGREGATLSPWRSVFDRDGAPVPRVVVPPTSSSSGSSDAPAPADPHDVRALLGVPLRAALADAPPPPRASGPAGETSDSEGTNASEEPDEFDRRMAAHRAAAKRRRRASICSDVGVAATFAEPGSRQRQRRRSACEALHLL